VAEYVGLGSDIQMLEDINAQQISLVGWRLVGGMVQQKHSTSPRLTWA